MALMGALKREVLLAPDLFARGAAALADEPSVRWMLVQPLAVRRTYVREVVDRGDGEAEQRAWMLSQADDVRESYIRAVLEAPGAEPPGPQVLWMLRQPEAVRASFIREVIDSPGAIRPDVVWMLRQPDAVRESYLQRVVLAAETGGD